jgi:monoamine oxidase
MAGLTAARALLEKGMQVTLLEARERVGGRIRTIRSEGEVIELGAEFVHGKPPELWQLIAEASEETYEVEGEFVSYDDGQLARSDAQESSLEVMEGLEGWSKPDITFAEYVGQSSLSEEQARQAIGYVEGFNAADHRVIGVGSLARQQEAEDAIDGDHGFRLKKGYDRLAGFLAEKITATGGDIILNTVVEKVEWIDQHVRVLARRDGVAEIFEAKQAVIALPLGVLQSHSVSFVPEPKALQEAERLRVGSACRLTLVFRERFWQHLKPAALEHLSFLLAFGKTPGVWWTAHPADSNTLTGWSGGPEAAKLLRLSREDQRDLACKRLAEIFSLHAGHLQHLLITCHMHNWDRDPLSCGAYSYVPAGALDACEKMTLPESDTLFFAGEHTDTTGHWGTVHAAIRSGHRAAHQILSLAVARQESMNQ